MLPITYANEQANLEASRIAELHSRRLRAEMKSLATRVEHADEQRDQMIAARLDALARQVVMVDGEIRKLSAILDKLSSTAGGTGKARL